MIESYCNSIDSKLSKISEYEKLKDDATLLELAIWKSKLSEFECELETDSSDISAASKRQQYRIECGANVIIPNVLSFRLKIHFSGANSNGIDEDEEIDYYHDDEEEDDEMDYYSEEYEEDDFYEEGDYSFYDDGDDFLLSID